MSIHLTSFVCPLAINQGPLVAPGIQCSAILALRFQCCLNCSLRKNELSEKH